MSILGKLAVWLVQLEGRKFTSLQRCANPSFLVGSKRGLALYIHIPFCQQPCLYCSFLSHQFDTQLARRYFQNLKTEIELYLTKGFHFSCLYVGGGTPTIMMDELGHLLSYLKGHCGELSISLETVPIDITPKNILLLKELNVRRLSVGVQSFNDEFLARIGRNSHSGKVAKEKIQLAKGAFDTLNIDILYDIPEQPLEVLLSDIEIVKELKVDQVTFYPFMPSPSAPSQSNEEHFYRTILTKMQDNGWKAKTAWCFCQGDKMIDEYILDYNDYIGVGCSAIGLLDGNLYVNTFSLERYDQILKLGKFPTVLSKRLTAWEIFCYRLLTRLFKMHIKQERLGLPSNLILKLLQFLAVIEDNKGELMVTEKGMVIVSSMMKEFFSSLNRLRSYCIQSPIC
ncbi:radical SAM protein [bacterium]|nr:radical SAM protein [bacterium]MBU2461442.1 radical SAM protein [bacterium]